MARRSKDGSIIINVGADAQRHLDRVAKRERIASERAAKREAKKAATKQRQALRQAGKRAAQMARAIQRQRDTDARRKAAREARKNWKPDPNRKKRSVHPKGKFATEKYNSYARRQERSRKLRATRTSPTTFTCNGYTIKVTAGSNPKALSCTCPDFTQMEGGRDWKGSNAGPFNPCKHMMAVKSEKWKCDGGVCSKAPDGIYNSEAECIAALVPSKLAGGQCATNYQVFVTGTYPFPNPANGVEQNASVRPGPINVYEFNQAPSSSSIKIEFNGGSILLYETNALGVALNSTRVIRIDGLPDNCGNPPASCPP